jgi:hypothetical protein
MKTTSRSRPWKKFLNYPEVKPEPWTLEELMMVRDHCGAEAASEMFCEQFYRLCDWKTLNEYRFDPTFLRK